MTIDSDKQWFNAARFGMFIHWGPFSVHERGEQVLFRERLDQRHYEQRACTWQPEHFDARRWAKTAVEGGFKYAVLTTRHHDGYCLWDSKQTDYTSVQQAPKRDFVREYVEAFREAGLRVGLYYSLADWRVPAYWAGPEHDPDGWATFRDYCHAQVRELLSDYGDIDLFWFDGAWPHDAKTWHSAELVDMMRSLQPSIIINDRLDLATSHTAPSVEAAGGSDTLGDYATPEHHITAVKDRLWESCQVSTWRLWGYTRGERWRPADVLLDFLCDAASKGGNLLLNVGPDGDGRIPPEFEQRTQRIGQWLAVHGEAIHDTDGGDVTEFVTRGRQTVRGNTLYLILRFYPGTPELRLAELATPVTSAMLLSTGQTLEVENGEEAITIRGLPVTPPTDLFPVVKLECDGPPRPKPWAKDRLWSGDPNRFTDWAKQRGSTVHVGR